MQTTTTRFGHGPRATRQAERSVTPAEVVGRYLASFASGDADKIASWVTADFANHHASALGEGSLGRDTYRERLVTFLATFVDVEYEVTSTIAEGAQVAAAYRMRGSYEGHPVDLAGVMVCEVRGRKVASRTDHWDSLTFLRQTGQA